MKKKNWNWVAISLVGVFSTFAVNAACTTYEYAEVKEMSAQEASLAYCNQVFAKSLIQNRMEMYERIRATEKSNLGAPSTSTMQKILEAGAEDSVCDREMAKIQKRLFALKVPIAGKCDKMPKPR
ncbi:hypothetical protein [Achromobacter denitrificans]|uniref:hypothetical protein n=1 Tax=Achromobacter denitrificans TaxID=32002 RepID=UPI0023E80D15|nr:hypothetical protein [Achromobacter denitrificans]MDF3849431.1 hypothetical protein [Achromobacter denitrificans]